MSNTQFPVDGIRIKGKCFSEPTDLIFFHEQTHRVAIVYGRNGSGKSTISRAFEAANGSRTGPGVAAEDLTVTQGAPECTKSSRAQSAISGVLLPEANAGSGAAGVRGRSVVFNEDFIDSQVRIEGDGIDSVVLLGEQVELQQQISQARKVVRDREEALAKATQVRDDTEVAKKKTDRKLDKKMKEVWGDRSRRISGRDNATTSWSASRAHLRSVPPSGGELGDVTRELEERIRKHQAVARSDRIQSLWCRTTSDDLMDGICPDLLSRSLPAPNGDGIRATIAGSLSRYENAVHSALKVFSDESSTVCPMCQQDVSEEHRVELIESIRDTICGDSDKFLGELRAASKSPFPLSNETVDPRLGEDLNRRVRTAIDDYNNGIAEWNRICQRKEELLYSALPWEDRSVRAAADRLADAIDEIVNAQEEWNSAVDASDGEERLLADFNDRVFRLEASDLFAECDAVADSIDAAVQEEKEAETSLSAARDHLVSLLVRASNVEVAATSINRSMRAILADRNRLTIEPYTPVGEAEAARYRVMSRGHHISPGDLSVGERNILALSYFFTLVQGEIEKVEEKGPLVVVIDDPISSVDVDNRLGVQGFLEAQMKRILGSVATLRILLLTHDLSVGRDLTKSARSALSRVRPQPQGKPCVSYILGGAKPGGEVVSLEEKGLADLNEYRELLRIAFEYASADAADLPSERSVAIGNVVRRVLEAFCKFIYNAGILDETMDVAYGKAAPDRELAVDLMAGHRSFLHGESHASDSITALRDFGGIAELGDTEGIEHVRRVLAAMYVMQPMHMERQLPKGSLKHVERWQKNLLES